MTARWRGLVLAAVVLASLVAAWRIGALMMADIALRDGDVERALRWLPTHPEALYRQAETRFRDKNLTGAAESARRLLAVDPIDGRAYRILAQVADAQGRRERAAELYRVAARRAPRDQAAHLWLIQRSLERGDRSTALEHFDQLLTHAGASVSIHSALVKLGADEQFADALADRMRARPAWRRGLVAALLQAKGADRASADQVLGAMRRDGSLDAEEFDAWIAKLMKEGAWAEAHARWAGDLLEAGQAMPMVFNGDFASEPSGTGFDWRLVPGSGALVQIVPGRQGGKALAVRFEGSRASRTVVEHALLLAPGAWRLRYWVRSEALHSDVGLGWSIHCGQGKRRQLLAGVALGGTEGWRLVEEGFIVPEEECEGQWLRLGNAAKSDKAGRPGRAPATQWASGELVVAAVAIARQPGAAPTPGALRTDGESPRVLGANAPIPGPRVRFKGRTP